VTLSISITLADDLGGNLNDASAAAFVGFNAA
jgi:hypothetical protein